MSAAVPAAELTFHFGERDAWQWRHHMGLLCDPLAAVDLYALEYDEHRGCHLADRHLAVPVCIYVAVDDADACLYIGQCNRPAASIVQRVDGHHAIPVFATGLWVLPLRSDCPKAAPDRHRAAHDLRLPAAVQHSALPPSLQSEAGGSVSTPVTPCTPEATAAFVERRFGPGIAQTLVPSARVAAMRQRRITELRRCGQLRHAERYGWFSLAGWLLGMKAAVVAQLDPTSDAIAHRARARDVLPDPLGDDPPPALVTVGDTGLQTVDPRDPLGYRVVELVAAAQRDGVIEIDGRCVGGGAVAACMRERLEEVARG